MDFSNPCLHNELEGVAEVNMLGHLRKRYPEQLRQVVGNLVRIGCGRCGEGCSVNLGHRGRTAWYIGMEKDGCSKEARG